MKTCIKLVAFLLLFSLPFVSKAQECNTLNAAQLKQMLGELGYEYKDLTTAPGKEKYEVKHLKTDFTIPVAYEISPSTNYIWLTVFLGRDTVTASRNYNSLLRQNGVIQPCQFYITEKGNVMLGLAVENRGVTNAILRRHTETICSNLSKTSDYWKAKP